jgi:hypothetical protein
LLGSMSLLGWHRLNGQQNGVDHGLEGIQLWRRVVGRVLAPPPAKPRTLCGGNS